MADSTVYDESDADLDALSGRTVAIIGYGNQGRAQAKNLRDAGVEDIVVGNRRDASWDEAQEDGFPVYETSEAVSVASVVFLLVPDEVAPAVYEEHIEPNLESGDVLNFASGYNVTYEYISPPDDVDVVMVAPRMVGAMVRELYVDGRGAPAFLAVEQDASGEALDVALAVAHGIGATRSGVIEGDFETETKLDLLTEQGLIPVIANALIAKWEVEREAGAPPEAILMEQYLSQELSHIFRKAATMGLVEQMPLHSMTSQYGQLAGIDEFDREPLREFMREKMDGIDDGSFATEWTLQQQAGYPKLKRLYKKYRDHEMIEAEQTTIDEFGLDELDDAGDADANNADASDADELDESAN
ncbi:ketol-acid reductoisomerase [Haloprofundus halophilus]|uniref:ketol-acid reductoisomerase n=1 Tax=Haloprofundus halophilus TaxID=2283527 RepID=UPI000E43E002|nr:ketol-acid reductoisomerase [Haloprofundus halophilus]